MISFLFLFLEFLFISSTLISTSAFLHSSSSSTSSITKNCEGDNDCGQEVCITDYLQRDDADGARKATKVDEGVLPKGVESYAGYAVVNTTAQNKLFFWYLPSEDGNKDAPTVIWLQGGPGGSSLFGMFAEMGPYSVESDGATLKYNPSTWNKHNGMLFIDNPVGAGYSYTETESYPTNTKGEVSTQLYHLLQQFYTVFPELLHNDLVITGESYAGHYVPGLAHKIFVENKKLDDSDASNSLKEINKDHAPYIKGQKQFRLPLKSIAIGDGWIDPYSQLSAYPEMLFNIGVSDLNEKAVFQDYVDRARAFIDAGDMYSSFTVWDEMINGDIYPYPNYFHNISGSNDYDNFMNTNEPACLGYYYSFVTAPATRKGIHVGNTTYGGNADKCEMALVSDFMVSFKDQISDFLNADIPVLIYSGQLDVIIGAALTEHMIPHISWYNQDKFAKSQKKVWRINSNDKDVAGYVKQYGPLTQAVVRGAGHLVPFDQPERALDLITKWMNGVNFKNLPNPSDS